LTRTYFMYRNNFIPAIHQLMFEKSLREGLHYRKFQFGKVVLAVCALESNYVGGS
ncbi:hypothetical protein EV421DRAFT_1714874, partial [Armillaria borealis]